MTQHDRLAKLLRETDPLGLDFGDWADALIARGVRVVDVETLTDAVHASVGSPFDAVPPYDGNPDNLTTCRNVADRVLAALDAAE